MRVPSYRLHKPTNKAVVVLSGRMHYLGPWQSPESKAEYERLVAEWLAAGRTQAPPGGPGVTVAELLAAYWAHAEGRGHQPQHLDSIKRALEVARRLYGRARASEFGGRALKACRQAMVDQGWCRTLVNQRVGMLKQALRWALSEELAPAAAVHSALAVPGLRAGEGGAREAEAVAPVAPEVVEATLPHLPPVVADMARVQLLAGLRPGEACRLRADEVERAAPDLWVWRPAKHKTAHRGHKRQVLFGPRAIAILERRIDGPGYVFRPAEAARPGRKVGAHYTRHAYARAIARACKRAGVEHWHPLQLRHLAATRIVAEYGWEEARKLLGHRSVNMTRIYAEDSFESIARIVREAG